MKFLLLASKTWTKELGGKGCILGLFKGGNLQYSKKYPIFIGEFSTEAQAIASAKRNKVEVKGLCAVLNT
jgi:hypothetical protein